ncbi:hypothetical protein FRC04_002033 [Tulasnella sp. 424]|nr:hypothetical protein FRC04_002033 [Tulasnella sp. 424]
MEQYGPPRDRGYGNGGSRYSNGGYRDRRSSYNGRSGDDGPSGNDRESQPYDDLDDPNRQPTPSDGLPLPVYSSTAGSADFPEDTNRYDRRNSFGDRGYNNNYDTDRDRGPEDYRDRGWRGRGRGRGRGGSGGPSNFRSRHDEEQSESFWPRRERGQDQPRRSNYSSNYNNRGGGRGQAPEGSGSPPAPFTQGSSAGGGGFNDSWGVAPTGDWRSVGNAGAVPAEQSQTTPTTAPTAAPVLDWSGWGATPSTEGNTATLDTPAATQTGAPTAQSSTVVTDPRIVRATQSVTVASPAPSDPLPAPADAWAPGWAAQPQSPATSQSPQPATATAPDPWAVQVQHSSPEPIGNVQLSSNQPAWDWRGEPRPSFQRPSPPAPAPEPTQPPMQVDSWALPTSVSNNVTSASPPADMAWGSGLHSATSSHSPTPERTPQSSPSESNGQTQRKARKDPSQTKQTRIFSKILPHCKRAMEKDPSVPNHQKLTEASSLAVKLAVEQGDLLEGLEEPALTLEIERLFARSKENANVPPPSVEQAHVAPITPAPMLPHTPFAPKAIPGSLPFKSNHSNGVGRIAPTIPDVTLQREAMQVDSDDSAVLARWTCGDRCSRATFAFALSQDIPGRSSTVMLVCRSPVQSLVDPYNEDGTWQVFTSIINRGTEKEEVHLLPPLRQSSYRTDQDLSLDITQNVQQGQNTVELKRMMMLGGLAGFTFEVKLIAA